MSASAVVVAVYNVMLYLSLANWNYWSSYYCCCTTTVAALSYYTHGCTEAAAGRTASRTSYHILIIPAGLYR